MPITLTANEVYSSLSNMIISQVVFSANVKRPDKLIDRFRREGGLNGDTKLFYAVDSLGVKNWPNANRKTSSSLLDKNYYGDPNVESIKIDTFKQIRLTTESVLSRRAWMSEGVFGDFNSVLISMMYEAKTAYEDTLFDAFVGTQNSAVTLPKIELMDETTATTPLELEAIQRINAQRISEYLENLFDDMKEYGRTFNALSYLRSYTPEDFILVFNNKYKNYIKYGALPTIFNKDLIEQNYTTLNHKFIGTISAATTTTAASRALKPMEIGGNYYLAGELVGTGKTVPANSTYIADVFKADDTAVFMLIHRDATEFDSAFTTQTEFWNAIDLDTNHYVTFGHNSLKMLQAKPYLKVLQTKQTA